MNLILAAVDLVTVGADNTVGFQPGTVVTQVLSAACQAAGMVVAAVAIWMTVGWMFRFVRLGSSQSYSESYDYKADNPWYAGGGGLYMPAEFSAFSDDGAPVIAYGAIVEPEAREVTVHSSVGDIRMGRGAYDRWMGLVDHEEVQGNEKF